LPITIRYTYVPTSLTFSSTPIELEIINQPPWVQATISPSTVYIPVSQTEANQNVQTKTAQAFLLVSTTPDAPAFTQGNLEVAAYARPNGNLQSSEARNAIPLQVDYFALLGVQAPAEVRLQPGRAESVPLTLTNFGNAATRVAFEVAEVPEGVKVTPPNAAVLESRQQGGEDNQATLTWRFEGKGGFDEGDAVLVLHPAYALDPHIQGEDVRVVVHVARASGGDLGVQGFTGATEGSALALEMGAVSAMGALAWAVHRRRSG
jgi:hypothetical protein